MSKQEESEENWVAAMDNLCSKLNVDPLAGQTSKLSFAEIKRNYTLDVSMICIFISYVIIHFYLQPANYKYTSYLYKLNRFIQTSLHGTFHFREIYYTGWRVLYMLHVALLSLPLYNREKL